MAEQINKQTNKPQIGQGSSTGGGERTQQGQSAPQKLQQAADQASAAGRDLKDQAVAGGRDLKEKVSELAHSSTEAVKEQASEFADAAKGFVSQAGETLKQRAYEQKGAGADYVSNIAESIRRAAREFDNDLPIAATYIRKAADKVEDVSDTVREGDFQDLVRGAQSFAQRQPTAFLGLAVLAGFGVVRFLKSSAPSSPSPTGQRMANSDLAQGAGYDGRRRPTGAAR